MDILSGGSEIKDIKIGSTAYNSVWIGGSQVWTRNLDEQTVTVGGQNASGPSGSGSVSIETSGYQSGMGSISDGYSNIYNNSTISRLFHRTHTYRNSSGQITSVVEEVYLRIDGDHSNSGWTTMTIAGTDYARTDASYNSYDAAIDRTEWIWSGVSDPFGVSGTTAIVTWT